MKVVLERAYKHLSNDKIMYFLINKFQNKIDWGNRYNSNYALSIANLIIEQQISFKAAITVKKRFSKLTGGKTSEEIIEMPNQELQSIGISYRKAEYIKNVFNFFSTYEADLVSMTDKDVIDNLCSIKGVGEWTAQMFLIFNLFRNDIFSPKDLALINSIKKNYSIEKVDKSEIQKLTDKWTPYNSVACLLLWESIENQVFFSDYN